MREQPLGLAAAHAEQRAQGEGVGAGVAVDDGLAAESLMHAGAVHDVIDGAGDGGDVDDDLVVLGERGRGEERVVVERGVRK